PSETPARLARPGQGIAASSRMIDAVKQAVVIVRASAPSGRPPGSPGRAGVGFVVDPSGYVVTSDRLIRGTSAIEVELADGRTLPVTRIATDPLSDVAVLKVNAARLAAIALRGAAGGRGGEARPGGRRPPRRGGDAG